jgi:glycosyltransferase involved in cell wall biosynthesis
MAKKQYKITFVLPFVNLTGGIKILFEHANRLVARGHSVTVVYPGILFHDDDFAITNTSWQWRYIEAPLRQLKYWLFVSVLKKTDADWFPLDRRVKLVRTPDLSARYLPAADLVIATAPETVHWVATYPDDKGMKIHLAQDYEVWALPEAFVDSTFIHTDMHLITIGTWQKAMYEKRFHRTVEEIIPDGVDTQRFHPAKLPKQLDPTKPYRVLMVYHHAAYKGMADGFAAIDQARKAGLSIQIVLFGAHPLKAEVPADVEYHQYIAEADLPNLYRSCDVFLWPTHREGFGLPPMEAMACGVPAVATASGAVPDYIEDGVTGYIVPIQRPDLLAEKLVVLLSDPKRYTQMSKQAAVDMTKWDWDHQTKKLEDYLHSIMQ